MNQAELDAILTAEQKAAGFTLATKIINGDNWCGLMFRGRQLRLCHESITESFIQETMNEYFDIYQAGKEDGYQEGFEQAQYTVGDWHKPA